MSDAVEAGWQNVDEETADKLVSIECHEFLAVVFTFAIVFHLNVTVSPSVEINRLFEMATLWV